MGKMKAHKKLLKVKEWASSGGKPVIELPLKHPTGPCDFSYVGWTYWFSSLKRVTPNNTKQFDVQIMSVCPRTGLLMTLRTSRHWENGVMAPEEFRSLESWLFEPEQVQRAYSNWLAEREIFK